MDPAPPAGGVDFGIVNHRDSLMIVIGLRNCSALRYTRHHNTHQMMYNMMSLVVGEPDENYTQYR